VLHLLAFFAVAMKMMTLAVTIPFLVSSATGMELTDETWDAAVAGKTVFVKFLAPW